MHRFILIAFALLICLPAAQAAHHEEDEEKTPLGEEMSAMNKAWRQLKKDIADPAKNDGSLKLLDQMMQTTLNSTDMIPVLAEDLPEDDQAAFLHAYQEEMEELMKELAILETFLGAGDNTMAQKLIKQIDDQKKKGHKEFKPKDD